MRKRRVLVSGWPSLSIFLHVECFYVFLLFRPFPSADSHVDMTSPAVCPRGHVSFGRGPSTLHPFFARLFIVFARFSCMDTKSHADTSTITSSADTTSSATNTTTASSTTSANITDITANPATTSISTPSRSKSPSPIPSTLSSKSGPVTSLSTDTVTVAANSNDGTDAKGQLTRAGSTSAGGEAPIREESREEGGMVEETRQEDQMWVNGTQSSEESTVAATTSHDTQETTQQENPTYTGSWWDYVGWGSSSATTRNESVPASGATDGNVVEDTVEGVKQDDSATESDHTVPSTEPSNAAISSDTVTLPPATAPAQSHASQVEPSPPEAEVSSTTGMKSAPPTVLAEDSKPPPRAASVFSGETVRSGAGSWLAPWTWYGGSGTSAPPTAAASSISVDIDKEPKLKRQMTESERVKEEALARDRGRENEAGAEAEAEKDGEPEQQPRLEQEETKDVGPSEEHAISSLPPAEQSASSPPATAEESASASLTSTPPTSSGWASFFSIGKGKGTSVKQIQDGSDDSQVKRDENGMEIMDLDEDEASAGDAQAGAISESKIDASSKAIPIQSKEVVKKESMKEILKAGATSPERKVSLVKALLQPSSSPKPASILSSLSSSPSKHPISGLPTKASATSDQDNITSASVSKDQIGISSRGRTDSMITTATSTSKASSVAKRAPLLVVSDDVKAKAATKAARSSSRGKEKEKDGSASGGEISDGKEKKEKSEKTKTKVEKKDSVKENDKDKKKDDKDKKHSKSNSGSSTPVPPAPPNLVLPTWADTFYTPPRSRLPSGVLPLTPLPGTEAYEAMYAKDEQKGLGSTLGRTMKYVSGVLFSGDRSNVERKKTSSLFGNASASGSDTTSKRGSESSMPVSGAGRRGSAASASSLPMSGGLVSPRIAALRAGSSSGRVGGSMKVGSAQAQTSKGRDVNIELMKEKERLYWDWGRSLPRSWEVVQFGQPIGLEQDDTDGVQEAGEDLKPEKAKAEEIDRDVSRSGQASSRSQGLIPGMGLEPGTTLSLPAHVLTNYKNKGKGREQALPEASAVEDVLKGCKKVVVIGIHGWFPGAVMRSVFGEPTGTSLKFVNMMVQALEVFQEKHGVRLEKITKIPLEGEGTIDRRVEKLYTNLVSNEEWMDDLHNTDVIFVATHSQGSVVSTHLLDRLIRERHIRTSKNGTTEPIADLGVNMVPLPPQRVCCLALCGIHLGPLRYLSTSSLVQPYIQYFESAAARELFEFQNTENEVSKSYVKALHNVVDNGTKMVYVASLNDQVVPIYSGLFTAASHPLILRALYIDGDAYNSSDFLSNLLVLLLRVLNTGLSDSGLLAHLSEVTAGSLNGVGHSTAYEELATYSLAVDYLFLANDGFDEHPELTFEPFNAASEMNDYEIPWALRDLIADERVAHFFSREITDLRDAFRDWNPKTSILRDIKRKLQPIQRLPSTLAPGSANSNSKL
ncbi:hypothetical protein D9758_008574 [Tetrapyrgos nigripes]|uniref:YMC020W-like alpha/beta hydrolase domain-containing protein n=1 Tax=Tetrapyrgos nigripes TaxID=182062 RepID=A0A8H5G5Q5_9AGAR|nr:hypothetical protein D9758_008574 [Tetrapyrgos nigripes]